MPELYVDNNRIKIRYLQCPCKIKYDEERFEAELITSHHMQRDTLNAKLKDIYMNHRDRLDVAMAADDICTAITNGEQVKGLTFMVHLGQVNLYSRCNCESAQI